MIFIEKIQLHIKLINILSISQISVFKTCGGVEVTYVFIATCTPFVLYAIYFNWNYICIIQSTILVYNSMFRSLKVERERNKIQGEISNIDGVIKMHFINVSFGKYFNLMWYLTI